jgi:hypothetical protein
MSAPSRPSSRAVGALFLVNAALALLNAFLSGPADRVVEWEARRRLTRALGPAARYVVSMTASWSDLLGGHIPSQTIEGRDIHMKDGLIVDALSIHIEGLTIRHDRILQLDRLRFRARVDEGALNAYIPIRPKRYRWEPPIVLRLTPGHVDVRVAIMLGVSKSVTGGTLLIERGDDQRVFFKSPVPLLELLPVIDLSDHPLGIHLSSLRILDHAIEIEGTATPSLPVSLVKLEASPTPSGSPSP